MRYIPIIGLEVHIELKTRSKMFCGCSNSPTIHPNTHICPTCLAHPGTLPLPNAEAIRMAITMASALECTINTKSKFDRKHYFYPDLPKGYQISQFDIPIGEHGQISIDIPEGTPDRQHILIGIERLHLEEDAAKNIHSDTVKKTLIDYNRAGVPLIELVSKPDLRSPLEAKQYLQEIRLLARILDISDGDMEKGHLRCDANISLLRVHDDGTPLDEHLNPKTEIKNINSFRIVERALTYEIDRQTTLWESGTPPTETTTRGWNDSEGKTILQRVKEGMADYRNFPDPDLPPLDLEHMIEDIRSRLPELPPAKRQRFETEYGVSKEQARMLTEDTQLSEFAENVYSELRAQEETISLTLATTWILNQWIGILNSLHTSRESVPVTAENFAELILLLHRKDITTATGIELLTEMTTTGKDPSHIMEDKHLGRLQTEEDLTPLIQKIFADHPTEVIRYINGEEKLLPFFMGLVMKQTEGRADPSMTRAVLLTALQERKTK